MYIQEYREMICVKNLEEAIKIFDKVCEIKEDESVTIENSIGRVLSSDIISNYDFPPYDRSAMDGFAFRYDDAIKSPILKVKDDVLAGHPTAVDLNAGECVKIMTGGLVPAPCDTVAEIEICKADKDKVEIKKMPSKFANIAFKGEDLKKGEIALKRGDLITTNKINLLASLGMKFVNVKRKLSIGVLPTGDELVDVEDQIDNGKIRDSSRYSLQAQINGIHQTFVNLDISRDNENEIRSKVEEAFKKNCDILLITGGSSVGDKDLTGKVLEDLGSEILVEKISMKPGAPTIISKLNRSREMWIFGMPGNPVSTYLAFEMVVVPLVEKMLGTGELHPIIFKGMFSGTFKKKADKVHFVPCRVENGVIKQIKYNGSGDFTSLSKANAFFIAPKETEIINNDDLVKYFMI